MYAQVTFGNYNRLYTFKVDSSISLSEGQKYDIIADETVYSTPVKVKKILSTMPSGLEGIYLKTINTAEKIEEEEVEGNAEISFI